VEDEAWDVAFPLDGCGDMTPESPPQDDTVAATARAARSRQM
jgi:hypothetical protein